MLFQPSNRHLKLDATARGPLTEQTEGQTELWTQPYHRGARSHLKSDVIRTRDCIIGCSLMTKQQFFSVPQA